MPPFGALSVKMVSIEEPDAPNVMLVWLSEAVMLVGTLFESRTVPVKPFRLVIVILDVPDAGAWTVKLGGLATILKSLTNTVTMTEWDNVPLVPVTLTLNVPTVEELTVKVDDADMPRTIMVGVNDVVRPVGETRAVSDTEPAKPFRLVVVTVEVPEEPTTIDKLGWTVDILKSSTWTVTIAWRDIPLLVPATVTV